MRRSLFLLAVGLVAAGCGSRTTEPRDTPPQLLAATGDTVTLKLGESVRVDPAGLMVSFDSVLADSRCPAQAACVWAGSVRVLLTVSENAGAGTRVKLESNLEPRSAEFGLYRITLLSDVRPEKGMPGPYVIRLLVARSAPANSPTSTGGEGG